MINKKMRVLGCNFEIQQNSVNFMSNFPMTKFKSGAFSKFIKHQHYYRLLWIFNYTIKY